MFMELVGKNPDYRATPRDGVDTRTHRVEGGLNRHTQGIVGVVRHGRLSLQERVMLHRNVWHTPRERRTSPYHDHPAGQKRLATPCRKVVPVGNIAFHGSGITENHTGKAQKMDVTGGMICGWSRVTCRLFLAGQLGHGLSRMCAGNRTPAHGRATRGNCP